MNALRALTLTLLLPTTIHAAALTHDTLFDAGWLFHRGTAAGAQRPDFKDANWRAIDLPHDWSIEDLPAREKDDTSTLSLRDDQWLFIPGDRIAWKNLGYNDSAWQKGTLPAPHLGSFTVPSDLVDAIGAEGPGQAYQDTAFRWYRRHITVPPSEHGKNLLLDMGIVMGADEAFFNGTRIGGSGNFPPKFDAYWSNVYQRQRNYSIPAKLVRGTDNVLAVRVYSPLGYGDGLRDVTPSAERTGPFDLSASPGAIDTGYTVGGTGWYRKHFALPPIDNNKLVSLRFDGVYMDADVWLNGRHLGNHPYGYTGFAYDLRPYLKLASEDNIIAVRVRNLGQNSRWYSGSGIYRHVWLTVTEPVHIALWGVSIATPRIIKDIATVKVVTTIENAHLLRTKVKIRVRLLAPDGSIAAESLVAHIVAGKTSSAVKQTLLVHAPHLWSTETPNLYRAQIKVSAGGKVKDSAETTFGIRSITVDAEHGLRINGQVVKLKGGCLHHDNGPLGSEAIDRAEERRVELLKANGYNAVRTSHNPPSPAFLDAADRLGILVIDESFDGWAVGKNPDDYHRFFKNWWQKDLDSMVLRDRNHPSVIMWSIGNEVLQTNHERTKSALAESARIAHLLAAEVKKLDPTRPVTSAYNNVNEDADAYFSALDVSGYNYNPDRYAADHQRRPRRIMLGTESLPARAFEYWSQVKKMPWVIGDFVWTAMDYIGESGIGHAALDTDFQSYLRPWPWHIAYCGDLDICGFKKPQSYYRDVLWGRSKLEMAVHRPLPQGSQEVLGEWGWPDEERHWTWPGNEGKVLQVKIYSSYPEVRLLLNSKEIGTKAVSADSALTGNFEVPNMQPETALTATFEVPYAPGELRAVGLDHGQEKESIIFDTAGKAAALRLTADRAKIRASRNDLSYVTVEAVDTLGNIVPTADMRVNFLIHGPGELAGVGNGNPVDTDSFQAPTRLLFGGRALAIVRPQGAPGTITLRAEAQGLKSAQLIIETD